MILNNVQKTLSYLVQLDDIWHGNRMKPLTFDDGINVLIIETVSVVNVTTRRPERISIDK